MQLLQVNQLFLQGLELHQQGQLAQAQALYQRVLKIQPKHFDALHLSGVVAYQSKKHKLALDLIARAIEINPNIAACYSNQGVALKELKQLEAAIASYDKAIKLKPDFAEAYNNRGSALKELKLFEAALESYNKAVSIKPDYAEAYYNRGIALNELKQFETAVESYDKAIAIKPDYAEAFYSRGNSLQELKQLDAAIKSYEKAIAIKPAYAEAYNNRGVTLHELEQFEAAVASYELAVVIKPGYAEAHNNKGVSLKALKQFTEAIASYEKALFLHPEYTEAYFNLSNSLHEIKRFDDAVAGYEKAISLKPDYAEAYSNRGLSLQELQLFDAAVASYEKAIEKRPNYAEAYYNRAISFQSLKQFYAAELSYSKAISFKRDYADAYNNLGTVLQTQGKLDNAIESFRKALSIKTNNSVIFSNLLFSLIYHPDKSAEEIFSVYQEYEDRFGEPCRKFWRDHTNDRETMRRLKVGYVSPDFRSHSVPLFLEPLLAHHDKGAVEVYAYAELIREDAVTARCKRYVEHWIPTLGLSDAAMAERIRADGIDILVDLAGHTDKNRLGVFALKPAPVSVTWLGYCSTTGLKAIDYFLTDASCVPLGSERLFSETPWRLEAAAYVYRPKEGMGNVNPLPAATRGFVTFGTLTRAVRINHRTVSTWAEILKQVPGSRLVLDSKDFWDEGMQEALVAKFAAHGINRERLEIGYHSPPWDVLRTVDIGLDCFPANSVTTLFETLNMGIPFITLAERPGLGRCGSSILESVGHPEWIAQSEEEYIKKAVKLASDLTALAHLRAGLREKMKASPLMDEIGFTRRIETAFQEMFVKWSIENQ